MDCPMMKKLAETSGEPCYTSKMQCLEERPTSRPDKKSFCQSKDILDEVFAE